MAEVGESEQCLSARAQATPAITALLAAPAELGGRRKRRAELDSSSPDE